jgi:hypothetical protein
VFITDAPIHHKRPAFAFFVRASVANKQDATAKVLHLGAVCVCGARAYSLLSIKLSWHEKRFMHARKLLPAALASVEFVFVLVRVHAFRIGVRKAASSRPNKQFSILYYWIN